MLSKPMSIDQTSRGKAFIEIEVQNKKYEEPWLQKLIHHHPEILPVAEIESIFSPMISLGTEIITTAGKIDNLFISQRGYPILVETKLWRNPEARRTVVSQVLEYASSLTKWDFQKLDSAVKHKQRSNHGIIEMVEKEFDILEGGHDFFVETVNKNLRLGRILIMIVADRIHESAMNLVDYINRYPGLAFDFALVELRCFKLTEEEWPLLVLPNIVRRTEIIERSVVQVNVNDNRKPEIKVVQEKAVSPEKRKGVSRSEPLTEEAFWELLSKNNDDAKKPIKEVLRHFSDDPRIEFPFGGRGTVIKAIVRLPDCGSDVNIFHFNKDGKIGVWKRTSKEGLNKLSFDQKISDKYWEQVKTLFKAAEHRNEVASSANKVDITEFIRLVEDFINDLENEASKKSV